MNNSPNYGDNSLHIEGSSFETAVSGSGNVVIIQKAQPPRTPTFPINNLIGQNPYFVGRESALQALTAATEPNAPATPLVIAGLGGVGKSQLLRHFGHEQRERFDIVWWVRVDETWGQEMLELGRQLCLPVDGLPLETALQRVRAWLNSCSQRWLLLCDNADATTAAQLHPLLPSHPQGRILITSRTEDWGDVARPFPLKEFVAAESDAFWRKRLGAKYQESGAWAELASLLGHLPLALEHSAAYMLATGTRPADYVRLFREKRQALWGKTVPPPDYPATVATTWRVNFEAARETVGAAELLALCAFLAPVDLPLELLSEATFGHSERSDESQGSEKVEGFLPAVGMTNEVAELLADELARNEAVAALGRYSLLQMGEDGQWGMHQLVQMVYRDQMGEAEAQGWVVVVGQWLAKVYRFDQYDMETWPAAARLLPHLQAAVAEAEHWGVEDEDVGWLNNQIGFYLQYYGLLQETWRYFERALAIYEKMLGTEHPHTANNLNNIGYMLKSMGQLVEARPYYERALAIKEKVLGTEHPDMAQSLNNMGLLLKNMGQLVEARPYYERALAIKEKVLGVEHPSTATSLNNMGGLLASMGQLAEARPYYEDALAICEKVLGKEHPNTAASLNNLAVLLVYMEDYPQATRLMRRALAIWEQKLGPNHPQTQSARRSLATIEAKWNQS